MTTSGGTRTLSGKMLVHAATHKQVLSILNNVPHRVLFPYIGGHGYWQAKLMVSSKLSPLFNKHVVQLWLALIMVARKTRQWDKAAPFGTGRIRPEKSACDTKRILPDHGMVQSQGSAIAQTGFVHTEFTTLSGSSTYKPT